MAAMVGNRSSVGRLRLSRPARATETGAEKGSPLKVPVTMDQQLEAQLERLRVAEKENAELKRMIDELEAELDIDFEMLESAAHDAMAGAGPTLPQLDESSSAAEEEVAEAIEEQEPEPELAEPSAASFEGAEAVEQEEVVAAMEEAAVAPVVDEPAASCTYTEDEILGWKVKELKAALKGAGLPVSGVKKVLQQRALENLL
ncbi:SAP domain-containing protein [Chloropicon roscoffensis]